MESSGGEHGDKFILLILRVIDCVRHCEQEGGGWRAVALDSARPQDLMTGFFKH